jgi:hypothetical protein
MRDCIRQSAASVESTRTRGILFVDLLVWLFIEFTSFSIVDLIGFWLVLCFFVQISRVDTSEDFIYVAKNLSSRLRDTQHNHRFVCPKRCGPIALGS